MEALLAVAFFLLFTNIKLIRKMAIYIVNTQSSNLNVRKEPNTSCDIIGKLAKGTEVEVSSINKGWGTLSFNGQTGYVSADYLKLKEVSDDALDALKF